MSRAIIVAFHKYTPFGGEFYEPILDFFIHNLSTFKGEFDHLYIVDSTWDVKPDYDFKGIPTTVIKVNPSLRYYDAYKEVLPQIKEDLVLFLDNDMVIYREGVIDKTFSILEGYYKKDGTNHLRNVVSIYDTIGDYKTDKLNGNNKFCPYWFATRKELLMKYLDVDWAPDMPYCETLGHLTEAMLSDGVIPYEWEEDKNSIYFDGTQDGEKSKDLGYYHIRSGSVPAYLLATNHYGNFDTYNDYLESQPRNEYLRQLAWMWYMCDSVKSGINSQLLEIIMDCDIKPIDFLNYYDSFKEYHNLP